MRKNYKLNAASGPERGEGSHFITTFRSTSDTLCDRSSRLPFLLLLSRVDEISLNYAGALILLAHHLISLRWEKEF